MSQGIKKINENVIAEGRSLVINNTSVRDNNNLEPGTLRCNVDNQGLTFKNRNNIYQKFYASSILLDGSINESLLGNYSISGSKLGNNIIHTDHLQDYCVSTFKLKNFSVTEDKLATASVTFSKIKKNTIQGLNVDLKTLTGEHIVDESLVGQNLASSTLEDRHFSVNSINGNKLIEGTIDSYLVGRRVLRNINFAPFTIEGGDNEETSSIAKHTITSFNLAPFCVTTNQLANESVTSDKFTKGCVNSLALGINQVNTNHLCNSAVTENKLSNYCVTTDKVAPKSITLDKLDTSIALTVNSSINYDNKGNVTLLKEGTSSCNLTVGSSSNNSSSLTVNGTVHAQRVYNMAYADLAEAYTPGEKLEAGDIVAVHEDGKVYKATKKYIDSIVGVVSTNYATCFDASEEDLYSGKKVAVALIGKVPVKINNKVKLGQKITLDNNGIGKPTMLTTRGLIGKTLESFDEDFEEPQLIMCLVFPN